MERIQELISLYHTGFLICTGCSIVFFLIAVIMFIRFNIPKILSDKTGRALKKSMKAVEEKNAMTGTLRSGALSGRMYGRRSGTLSKEASAGTAPLSGGTAPVSRIVPPPAEVPPVQGTDILTTPPRITEQTGGGTDSASQVQLPSGIPGSFRVTKRVLLIHTEEVI